MATSNAATFGIDNSISGVVPASAMEPSTKPRGAIEPVPPLLSAVKKPGQQSIDRSKFMPAFTPTASLTQAERVAVSAIERYLQNKTNSDSQWNIRVTIPPEHAQTFLQRRQIIGVAGGQPPWEGEQDFEFLINAPAPVGEYTIPVKAIVEMPEMVLAANRALSKGYVLKEADLVWIPIPKGSAFSKETCISEMEQAVGKQLRRAMSTQQIIKLTELGQPTIIKSGEVITIQAIAGDITVESEARALDRAAWMT